MILKRIFLFICIFIFTTGYAKPTVGITEIDAVNNAYIHNNHGLVYMEMGNYYAAVLEYKMAIQLNPNTQATAIYYNNLAKCYLKLDFYKYAAECELSAIKLYPLNIEFYINLAKAYKGMGILDKKIVEYSKSTKALDKILIGLMYAEKGDNQKALIVLDDFCMSEPDLIITKGVKYNMHLIKEGKY